MKNLSIKIEQEPAGHVIRLAGRLDALNSTVLERDLTPLIGDAPIRIALDCTNVEYLSSAGIRVILTLSKLIHSRHGLLVMFGVREDVMEIIKIAGFEKILRFCKTEQEAVNAFRMK